jgi:hypothetical protein
MWPTINNAANAVFDAWLWPWSGLPVAAQVCITALPVTAFALLVFRYCSSQSGIATAKDRIKGYLLELWLYKDDPAVLLRAQGQVVLNSLEYLGYSLVPMAVMIVPLALVMVQLESRFAFRPLQPGESAVVTATLAGTAPVSQVATDLAVPPELVAETTALRLDDASQVLWRIRAEAPGEHTLRVRAGGGEGAVPVLAGATQAPVAVAVYRATDWRVLGHPTARPLAPDGPVDAIEVGYPRARGEFLGLSSASWLLLGASLVLGFALRGWFGVTF